MSIGFLNYFKLFLFEQSKLGTYSKQSKLGTYSKQSKLGTYSKQSKLGTYSKQSKLFKSRNSTFF